MRFQDANLTSSSDKPEGLTDALMQVAVCEVSVAYKQVTFTLNNSLTHTIYCDIITYDIIIRRGLDGGIAVCHGD